MLRRISPIILAAVGVACIAGVDACIKHLGSTYDTFTVAFGRYAVAAVIALGIWTAAGRPRITTDMWRAHGLRGIFAAGAGVTFFYGLPRVPLAEAIAFTFIAPVLIPFMAWALLGERVRRESILAALIGFAGAAIATQGAPSLGAPRHPEYALGVAAIFASAVLYALTMAMLRQRAGRDGAAIVGLLQALIPALLVAGPAVLLGGPVALSALPVFGLMGLFGAVGWFAMINAYARAEAQRLAPVEFTALGWGALTGFLLFNEVPRLEVLIGAALIVAACLYSEWSARRVVRGAPLPT